MSELKKNVVITFLGNAHYDTRVVNLINSLKKLDYNVSTISFDWKTKNFKTIVGETSVYKLDKSKSSLSFYFTFIFRLIQQLLKLKADIYFAEDVYTLPFVYFFAKKNNTKIFYNSREIYAHLAGLRNKSIVQKIIAKIEDKFIRKVDVVLVTGEMDAEYLCEAYSINNLFVLRNLPNYQENIEAVNLHQKLNIPTDQKIILYQGVILEGRGITKVIDVVDKIPNTHFVIIGEGELKDKFIDYANERNVSDRVHFYGAVNHKDLLPLTSGANLGIALIENISISYYYALPNKLFEYIMSGIPVLVSDLPQMRKVVEQYKVGEIVNLEDDEAVISKINEILNSEGKLQQYKKNTGNAAKELNWENEFEGFKEKYLN